MSLGPFADFAADLAPGDRRVLDADWSDFTIERVRAATDPLFDEVFERLWQEFGARGEMERREILQERLRWDPRRPIDGHALLYEMLAVRRRGELVAMRDHTVVLPPALLAGDAKASAVVHLSHVLLLPALRGSGLASWLRALPLATARRCFELAREAPGATLPAPVRMTLVAEMEHDDGHTPAVVARLRSYARAGFRMADPSRIDYCQPDFRAPELIDASAPRPVPLCLVLRRVGREHETEMASVELAGVVAALHAMFGVQMRAAHLEGVRVRAARLGSEAVALRTPGSTVTTATEDEA